MSEYIVINTESGGFNHKKEEPQKYNSDWNMGDNLLYYHNTVEKNLRGWFFPYDHGLIHIIMKQLLNDVEGDVAEIGVAFGRSAIAISNYRPVTDKLYLYDYFSEEERIEAENNIKQFGTFENVEWRIGDTTKLNVMDIKFDRNLKFLHIDGCHEHAAVVKDLKNFSLKMVDGGIIVMDDYNDIEYPGINSGTLEFLLSPAIRYSEDGGWIIFAIGQNKAYLCKKKYFKKYVEGLLIYMEQYKNFGLQYKPNLKGFIDRNVLLCCSREEKSFEEIKQNINIPVRLV